MMLLSAIIWGFAFVAQKTSMEVMGPFTFNTARFVLGASFLVLLLPFIKPEAGRLGKEGWFGGMWMGVIIFIGSITQQIGIVTTTAAKAAFITGIYIVIVPIILSFMGQALSRIVWWAVALSVFGLYLLSMHGAEAVPVVGDFWVLLSAIFFALHIIVIGKYSRLHDPLKLSIVQFYICALLSAIGMFIIETPSIAGIKAGGLEILYAGVLSVGIAYTLQVFAQKRVPAHIAALVLSLEIVFGAIGGIWLLGEQMTGSMLLGGCFMFAAILLVQGKQAKQNSV